MSLTATATARATDTADAAQAAEQARRDTRRKLVHDRLVADVTATLGPDVPVLYLGEERGRHPVLRGGAYSGSYIDTEPHVVLRFTVDDLTVRVHDKGSTHRATSSPADRQVVAGFQTFVETGCAGCGQATSSRTGLPFGEPSLLPDRLADARYLAAQQDRVLDQIGTALRGTGARCWTCQASVGSACTACHRPW